ncbi:hypothetical protein ETAA8_70360 [Anatilimnocola aggregata]|uniref:Uncharacterized protein n=1 Tax=Anatilimnocola aggregata TaxID=2528021 RepID=A0A517YNR8_9BACT|nr:hypothetical protein [Anatilimnocola aggregata]QDU31875.1 hypothetical protein ETAA8_70360 [Anatilimnocola aggregata]
MPIKAPQHETWPEKLIAAIFVLTCLSANLGVSPGIIVILLGFEIDLLSLGADLHNRFRGYGPSGFPVLGVIFYAVGLTLMVLLDELTVWQSIVGIVCLIGVHLSCQYLITSAVGSFFPPFQRKQPDSEQ